MIGKILEAILKNGIQPIIDNGQNDAQRCFTANTSPLNAALTVEEFIRRFKACVKQLTLSSSLFAKSAFDVVNHNHIMRRLYHIGVQNRHWILINDMHQNATSIVK